MFNDKLLEYRENGDLERLSRLFLHKKIRAVNCVAKLNHFDAAPAPGRKGIMRP
jgi:hypothetical protein